MLFNDLLVNGLLKGWLENAPKSILSADMTSKQWKIEKDYLRTWIVSYNVIGVSMVYFINFLLSLGNTFFY